ncbi:MAG: TetR/AcrR family transcriptional regulator [Aureispira sp.]
MGRKSKAEVRKKEILDNFHVILKEEGFENASIAKVAKRMEVNPSLLIHYYGTKEKMVVSFVDNLLEQHENNFRTEILATEQSKATLEEVLAALFGEAWLNYADPTVFYAFYYLSARNEAIKSRFQQMYGTFRTLLLPLIRTWMEAKRIKEDDPEMVADYILMMNEGLLYYDKLMRDPQGFKRRVCYLKEAIIKTLTT